jgi:O-antigen/teichoic acid export membrane protein
MTDSTDAHAIASPLEAIVEEERAPAATRSRARLVRSVLAVGLGVGAANLLHFFFHLVEARILQPAEYATLASLLAVVLVVTVPILAVQATVAREVAVRLADEGPTQAGLVLRESARWLARWSAVLLAAIAVLAVPLALLFDVRRPLPAVATVAKLLATVTFPVAWGGLQGTGRFLGLGAAQAGFAALKFLFGVALGLAGLGSAGVMFGVAAAAAISVALAFRPLRPIWNAARRLPHRPMKVVGRHAVAAVITLGLFALLTNVDVMVARIALPETVAGLYAATSVAAKTLLLIPLAVTTVLFPHVATLRDRASERFHLVAGLVTVGALGLVATAILLIWPRPLLNIAFGGEYVDAAPWLGPLAGAMALYAVAQVYVFHFLSVDRGGYAAVLGAISVLQVAGFVAFHGDPMALVRVQIITGLVTLLVSEVFDRREGPRGPAPAPPG